MQWLLDHPQYIKNPLYIAGDSYSGVIVPQVTLLISNGKHSFILNNKKRGIHSYSLFETFSL